jgi:CRISPR-associated protein Csb2
VKPLVLKVTYLTGRSVASEYNDREKAEWPPHPARLYSALVATWAESEEQDPQERESLEWLAARGAPSIYAAEAVARDVVPFFVPVNDVAVLDSCDRQRTKLAEAERSLDEAKARFQAARGASDGKAAEKASKALAQEEKKLGTEVKKLEKLLDEDLRPYADGKQPAARIASAKAMLPEHRGKQPRSFPSVGLDDNHVFFSWPGEADEADPHRERLARLAMRVVRLGHSSSLVTCAIVEAAPAATWEPNEAGSVVLRVPDPNQLALLEAEYARHKEVEPRVLPRRFQRYAKVGATPLQRQGASCFGTDWIVFRQTGGRRLSQIACVNVARAMRGALLKHAADPPPELMSGHKEDGERSDTPHLAILPLPFVGSRHATGELLGLALVLPRAANEAQRSAVLRAIGAWENAARRDHDDEFVEAPPLALMLGHAGVVTLERVEWGSAPLKTLRAETWCEAAHSWVTATPIALDRNPGNLFSAESDQAQAAYHAAAESIVVACERIGLPRPSYVQVHPSVPLQGGAKARVYPAFPADPGRVQRVKVHARIEFPVPVSGPILLGAGRYYGLGLCLPQPYEARVDA